jgi:hypothetical protein
MGWINLIEGMEKWQAVLTAVMNTRVPRSGEFRD